ncbi:Hypothetical predicted protein [Scomber scombrus]|uniref:Uncharacterized protein n=1 Tax=Scomber scombrus TaxID=13677 RepID=A0AAV1N4N4_SCOSC
MFALTLDRHSNDDLRLVWVKKGQHPLKRQILHRKHLDKMAAEVTLGREASEEGDKTSNIVDDIGSDDEFQIF